MIKWIKRSLTVKIFLITSVLLLMVSAITYGFVAFYMPKTYSYSLKEGLDNKAANLIENLKKTTYEESGELFDKFISDNDVTIELRDLSGAYVYIPSNIEDSSVFYYDTELESEHDTELDSEFDTEHDSELNTELDSEIDSEAYIASNIDSSIEADTGYNDWEDNYDDSVQQHQFSFKDDDNIYILTVIGNMREINQAIEALDKTLPLLALMIVVISLITSILYAFYISRPILMVSQIAKKMSVLDFADHCSDKRTDEIGVLEQSLNELSQKLSAALNELQAANVKLQDDIDKERELERKRREFFAAVSHELKTPITVLKGQLEGMLYQVGAYKDRDKYLMHSYRVVSSMEELVGEILTVAKMESADFVLKPQLIDLGRMVKACVSGFEDLFQAKQMELRIELNDGLIVTGAENLLRKVINNIISNAILYSPERSTITIKAYSRKNQTIVWVENTGVHIPDIEIPKLFQPFYRLEKSRNRGTGGSGLGLYIIKMILNLHQAEYKLENTPDGVAFTVILQLNND